MGRQKRALFWYSLWMKNLLMKLNYTIQALNLATLGMQRHWSSCKYIKYFLFKEWLYGIGRNPNYIGDSHTKVILSNIF